MARGKKPGVSSYERRRWLGQLDAGKGITEIARAAKRDIRIVKRHIEVAREEVMKGNARKEFLLSLLQRHMDDLLDEVGRLTSIVSLPIPRTLIPGRARHKYYDALKEHLKKSSLKGLLELYEEIVLEADQLKQGIMDQLLSSENELKATLPEEAKTYPWIESIVDDLISGFVPDESVYTQNKQSDGTYEIKYKNRNLTHVTLSRENAESAVELHKKLLSMIYEHKPEIDEYRQRRNDIVEMITDELDVLAMKRLVPGRCRYCPF
jgi:hypothetical protein